MTAPTSLADAPIGHRPALADGARPHPSPAGSPPAGVVRRQPADRPDREPPAPPAPSSSGTADLHQPGPTVEAAGPVVGPPTIARRQPDTRLDSPSPTAESPAGRADDRPAVAPARAVPRTGRQPTESTQRPPAPLPTLQTGDPGVAAGAVPRTPRPPAPPPRGRALADPEPLPDVGRFPSASPAADLAGLADLADLADLAGLADLTEFAEPASRSTTVSRSELRRQRLIGSDPTRPLPAPPATPAVESDRRSPAPEVVPRPRPRRATHRRATPALPGASHDGPLTEHPVRRVTLPRAMSTVHRPTPTTAPASVRPPAGLPAERATRIDAAEIDIAGIDIARIDIADPARQAADPTRSVAGAALADRFLRELSQTAPSRPAPLPAPFRPMAEQIAGRRPVMLSTDPASRRALRKVGKRAATTGATIHLDATPRDLAIPSARVAEVVAHELTHVAHPSPAPRFFDDIDESPEERRAERVARTIANSPLAPAASPIASPHAVLRRAPSPTSPTRSTMQTQTTPAAPGTIDAATLAASITGEPAIVRRQHTVAVPAPQPTTPPPAGPAPATATTAAHTAGAAGPAPVPAAAHDERSPAERDEEFRALLERNLDVILRRVEDHILIDIERRGGRAWRGF